LHWQLTTGNNEHHQIKTIKSGPKIQKNVIFQKTKTKLLNYQIQMKIPNALALAYVYVSEDVICGNDG